MKCNDSICFSYKPRFSLFFGGGLFLVLLLSTRLAFGAVVLGNYPPENNTFVDIFINEAKEKALLFEVPAGSAYVINTYTVRLGSVTESTFQADLYLTDGTTRGALVASLGQQVVNTASYNVYADITFAPASPVFLLPGQRYWLQLSMASLGTGATWAGQYPVVIPSGTFTAVGFRVTHDSGSSWTISTEANTLSLDADPAELDQTITFDANPGPLVWGGSSGSVSATASSGLSVTFSTTSPACTVDATSGAIDMVAIGSCVITANQAGNSNYNPAPPVNQTVVINKGVGTVTFGMHSFPYDGNTHAIAAVITEESGSACTVSPSPIGPDAGSYPVTATCSSTHYEASGNAMTSITAIDQTIDFGANPGPLTFGGTSGAVSATATSGLPVTFSTASVACLVDAASGAITMNSTGDCVITASQPGNGNYNAALSVDQTVVIIAATQAITDFVATPTNPAFVAGGTFVVAAQGGASGQPVIFSSLTPEVCSVSGNLITMLIPGTCTLVANQAGDGGYGAAPATTLSVVLMASPILVPAGSFAWLFALGLLLMAVGMKVGYSRRI